MRSLKPEFWDDEELATVLSRDARMLYMGLWNQADEHARCRGDARWVKGKVFAYDDDLTPSAVDALLNDLAAAGKVVRYRIEGASYLFLPNLAKHQRLEPEKTPSRLPEPPSDQPEPPDPENRANDSGNFPDESALARARSFNHVAGSMEQVAGSREESRAPAQTSTRPPIARFDELWAVYPLQDGQTAARKAWADAIKRDTPDAIIAGAIRYRDSPRRTAQYTKLLANWLKDDCWRDTHAAAAPPPRSARAAPDLEEHNGLMLGASNVANLDRHRRMAALQAQRDAAQPAAIEGRLL